MAFDYSERWESTSSSAEWLAATDPEPMLRHVTGGGRYDRSPGGLRKLRLAACAFCRRIWHMMEPYKEIRECVEFAEGYADGVGAKKRLKKLCDANTKRFSRYGDKPGRPVSMAHTASAARITCDTEVRGLMAVCRSVGFAISGASEADYPAQVCLTRCVFGNPFRPVALDPAWLTPTAVAIATGIYQDRAFDRLPILADALEYAGCDNADALLHFRGPGPHARGCWVVDHVLGKA